MRTGSLGPCANNGRRKPPPSKYSSLQKMDFLKHLFFYIKYSLKIPLSGKTISGRPEHHMVRRNGKHCAIIFQLSEEVDGCEPRLLKLQLVSGQRTNYKVWFLLWWANFPTASFTSSLLTLLFDICHPGQTPNSHCNGRKEFQSHNSGGDGLEWNVLTFFM